jgi:hypothetical protein
MLPHSGKESFASAKERGFDAKSSFGFIFYSGVARDLHWARAIPPGDSVMIGI